MSPKNASADNWISLLLWILVLHGVWWVIGVDQIMLPLTTYFCVFTGAMLKKVDIKLDVFSNLVIVFILINLGEFFNVLALPGISHYGPLYVYRTFLFMAPLFLLLLCNSIVDSDGVINKIITFLIVTVFTSCLVSFVAYILYFKGLSTFHTVLSYVAPGGLKRFGILNSWFEKSVIRHTWVVIYSFYRPRGLFNFGNLFSLALEITIPLSIYMAITFKKKIYGFIALCLFSTLILTTSRAGIILTFFGLMFIAIIMSKRKVIYISLFLLCVLSLYIVEKSGYKISFSPGNLLSEAVVDVDSMRGDSTDARQEIYEATIEHIAERPIFGWGTYRMMPNKPLWPYMGSHSTYLSTLFRLGVIGLIFFLAIFFLLLKRAVWIRRKTDDKKIWNLSNFMIGIILIIMLHMLVLDIHDDIVSLYIVWFALMSVQIMYRKVLQGNAH